LLSGQDFDPETEPRTPYEAGIDFAVSLDGEFVGRDALRRVHEEGPDERLTGFSLLDRGVPRHGYSITDPGGTEIGTVTSGTMSPSLGTPIGMGYLPAVYAEGEATDEIAVVIRGEAKRARVETPPFIDT
jgi:aminomethyltransferase